MFQETSVADKFRDPFSTNHVARLFFFLTLRLVTFEVRDGVCSTCVTLALANRRLKYVLRKLKQFSSALFHMTTSLTHENKIVSQLRA